MARPSSVFRWGAIFTLVILAVASSLALAKVPLGERVPASLRGNATGPYWIVFYTRSCLEPARLAAHWDALRAGGRTVLAVNPVETGNVALAAPQDFRALTGPAALELSRALRVREYPTTVLVDGDDITRAAFEGPVTRAQVQDSLSLLQGTP